MKQFDVSTFDVPRFDAILSRGLSVGVGEREGQMCIEAAICTVLDLPHGDDPQCVTKSVRSFKISLNDREWSSPTARSTGLRDLGLAQLGSLGIVDSKEFATRLAKKTIGVMLPMLIREKHPTDLALLNAAQICENEGTLESALALRKFLWDAYADAYAYVYVYVYTAAAAAAAADAAAAAAAYAYAFPKTDKYLLLGAKLALDVLQELGSPGIALLDKK